MDLDFSIVNLYRYFAYSAHMRQLYIESIDEGWLEVITPDLIGMLSFMNSAPGIYFVYAYSGIYLVIEGWRELGLADDRIDELLESPYVDRLRRFRNATFHFQKQPLSMKHFEFFGTEEEQTEVWLNKLYREFERFFKANTLPLPDALKQQVAGETPSGIIRTMRSYLEADPDAFR